MLAIAGSRRGMLVWRRLATLAAAGALVVASAPTSNAAGADLTLTAGSWLIDTSTGVVWADGISVIVPSSVVVQPDGRTHRVFDVGSLTADAGATVRISGLYSAEFQASGPVTIGGTIDAVGGPGGSPASSSGAAGGVPGPGAASGGSGGAPGLAGGDGAGGLSGGRGGGVDRCGGLGGIGGVGGTGESGGDGAPCPSSSTGASGNGGGGGGGSASGAIPSFGPGAGGGGGGSVGSTVAQLGGGGGGGGGKVVFRSTHSITVSGNLLATGGRGGPGRAASGDSGGGGGGGGGGALAFDAPSVTFAPAAFIDARGGIRGDPGDASSGLGGRGGNGTVFVRSTAFSNLGTVFPTPIVSVAGPRSLVLDPPSATRPVGSLHTITATASDPVVAGLPVRFTIVGTTSSSALQADCVTDAAGQCSMTYSGGQFSPGTDLVEAYVDVNSNAAPDAGEPAATATVVWSDVPTYSIHGFAAPVDATPSVNVARAGQSIPLKFSVVDESGAPAPGITGFTIKVTDSRCDLGSTLDQIEEYVSGGSGLRDFGDGTYQFNWATPKSYAKSCKQLTLSLPTDYDGNAVTAEFRFVK